MMISNASPLPPPIWLAPTVQIRSPEVYETPHQPSRWFDPFTNPVR